MKSVSEMHRFPKISVFVIWHTFVLSRADGSSDNSYNTSGRDPVLISAETGSFYSFYSVSLGWVMLGNGVYHS
jgi:hypothetical protein